MAEKKPMIAVPIGDPAGVGPEIVAKACALEKVNDAANVIVIGDRQVMEKAISIVGADLKINVVEKPADGDYRFGILNLIDLDNIDQSQFSYGVVQAMCGKAAFAYIKKSIELAMNGRPDQYTRSSYHVRDKRSSCLLPDTSQIPAGYAG